MSPLFKEKSQNQGKLVRYEGTHQTTIRNKELPNYAKTCVSKGEPYPITGVIKGKPYPITGVIKGEPYPITNVIKGEPYLHH
ncbi:hypothetical protein SK128_023161, partial [Halocaridina rubra]